MVKITTNQEKSETHTDFTGPIYHTVQYIEVFYVQLLSTQYF